MTDENNDQVVEVNEVPVQEAAPPQAVPVPRLDEVDRLTLELAKNQRLLANSEAKTALANSEKSDLAYKNIVLQLYLKYGLSFSDAIKETGEIVFGGALPQNQNGN